MSEDKMGVRHNWRTILLGELTPEERAEYRRELKEEREAVLPKQGSEEHMHLEVYEYNRLLKHRNVRVNWREIEPVARNAEEIELARIARIKEIRALRGEPDWYYFSPDD
ncbi:hypothetical protein GCM10027422_12360 [Hymenobacter arcticus]